MSRSRFTVDRLTRDGRALASRAKSRWNGSARARSVAGRCHGSVLARDRSFATLRLDEYWRIEAMPLMLKVILLKLLLAALSGWIILNLL